MVHKLQPQKSTDRGTVVVAKKKYCGYGAADLARLSSRLPDMGFLCHVGTIIECR